MGKLMGVRHLGNNIFEEADNDYHSKAPLVPEEDWRKIVNYYLDAAPQVMELQKTDPVKNFTNRFIVKQAFAAGAPSNTFLKIDSINSLIYAANRIDSSIYTLDRGLRLVRKQNVHGVVVDMFFENYLKLKNGNQGVLTKIGIMDPNDFKTGSAEEFVMDKSGRLARQSKLFDTLTRPVQTIKADLDGDGSEDYLICGFGNKSGSFYWMKNQGNGSFEQKILRNLPGATKAYIADYNKDGLPDILALFAQAEEGIFLFINKGKGAFETREVLRFPPVYGSSYFELNDIDHDGDADIIYTCGDNADYSSNVLKNYHGVYIFINKGDFTFSRKFFYPIHGAYKAVARDFDKDGDIDVAVISFFPDKKHQPQEAFVYLENTGNFTFTASTIKEYNAGNWITMDAADVDKDGDDDIVIGNLYLPYRASDKEATPAQKPFCLLLVNQTVE
jgi:hypothetical protein